MSEGFIDKIGKSQKNNKSKILKHKINLKKYICFNLNEREYGIEINNVREIIEYNYIRKIIYTPDFLMGLINLRGSIISVFDLKLFFGLGTTDTKSKDGRLMVLNVEDKTLCFAIDKISKIREIIPTDVQAAPATFNEIPSKYIVGMYKTYENNLLVLINFLEIVNSDKIKSLSKKGNDSEN